MKFPFVRQNQSRNSQKNPRKISGFSLLEVMIAGTISAILLGIAFGSITTIQLNQKRLQVAEKFYTNNRLFLERIVRLVRENTIDYDRYFIEIGPDGTSGQCEDFASDQLPMSYDSLWTDKGDKTDQVNSRTNRAAAKYANIFLWDTIDTFADGSTIPDGETDRTLGGYDLAGAEDPCTQSFYKSTTDWDLDLDEDATLYLIDTDRTKRFALRFREEACSSNSVLTTCGRIDLQVQLGVDRDNDGEIEVWGPDGLAEPDAIWTGTQCQIDGELIAGENSAENCYSAHDWEPISPLSMRFSDVTFLPSPDRDPYLAFRVISAQQQPRADIAFTAALKDYERYSFNDGNQPTITLQTTASSRVFGNNR